MTRKLALACLLGGFLAAFSPAQTQSTPPPEPGPANKGDSDDGLEEEDESVKPRVYPFNPLEAERNIKVGGFYMHQGTPRGYRAALGRFEDATKYNPGSAEAFFRVGEAEEKLKHPDKAKAAFQKTIQLAPDSKFAKDAKKKLEKSG